MEVKIIAKSPYWTDTLYTAIKTCKSIETPQELFNSCHLLSKEKKHQLIYACFNAGHLSVFEHISITFAVANVSRVLLAQYSRHRIGISLSVQSERSVFNENYYIPEKLFYDKEIYFNFKQYVKAMQQCYKFLRDNKVAPEDARFILTQNTCTNFVTTLNLRALIDIFNKRVKTPGAQDEIKQLVSTMAKLVTEQEEWTEHFFKINK